MISFIKLLRPHQWIKNLMIYFPPFLGGALFNEGVWQRGIIPFAIFSLASSAGYIVNDLNDLDSDRNHPAKSKRPVASGSISKKAAWALALIMGAVSLLLAISIQSVLLFYVIAYLAVSISYTLLLKSYPVVDIFCIASGFLIRLEAGGRVFGIDVSEWLFLSVLLLSLFLSAGKRLSEKISTRTNSRAQSSVLSSYPEGLLDGMLYMTGGAVLVTYTMYTLNHRMLVYTVPLCCFGLMRYLLRVKSGGGGDPSEALLRDPWLFAVGASWSALAGWGIYGG